MHAKNSNASSRVIIGTTRILSIYFTPFHVPAKTVLNDTLGLSASTMVYAIE